MFECIVLQLCLFWEYWENVGVEWEREEGGEMALRLLSPLFLYCVFSTDSSNKLGTGRRLWDGLQGKSPCNIGSDYTILCLDCGV